MPPSESSRAIVRSLHFAASVFTLCAICTGASALAFLMTGTISPASVSTAQPRLTFDLRMISPFASSTTAFRLGCFFSPRQIAVMMNGSIESFSPTTFEYSRRFASSAVTSASSTTVKWTAVCTLRESASAILRRTPRNGTRCATSFWSM